MTKNASLYSATILKCRQLVMAWNVPYKKVPYVTRGGQITQMLVVDEAAFRNARHSMMLQAEKRGCQWYHPKMGRFATSEQETK